MRTFFKCDVKYNKVVDGEPKEVTEAYLVEAATYTDAEAKIYKHAELITKEFTVEQIVKFKLTDLIEPDFGATFFLAKSSWMSVSNKGKEKKVTEKALVNANTIHDALSSLKAYHKAQESISALHIRIESMVESPILEVFI